MSMARAVEDLQQKLVVTLAILSASLCLWVGEMAPMRGVDCD